MTSKKIATLSVTLATYNESKNIVRCLSAIADIADEIIVVDGQSQDNTAELVKKFKQAKVISTTNKPMFHLNKQMGISKSKGDWILQLDADEVVTDKLKAEIKSYLQKDPSTVPENGFWIPRKNYFLGTFLTKGGQYPDPTIRFYKNGTAYLPCQDVHEQAVVKGPVGWLKNDLEHYADTSFSLYLLRANRYTTLLAEELKTKQVPLRFTSFINYYLFKPLFWFLKTYFRHRGYVDGFPGFVFSFYSALRFPIAYTKYYELTKTNRDINLSQDWDKK
ncbi:MAG TPA: glycosyltransferase family 2 protein [Candidatus Woesebacteria bacterium]|jgi:glycosyltransferase involved in cell wall biosynthesis|nr:glycosyltransferase family 2 protein [Candidatus Shapirobacteria bacterium]HOR02188.1 glycosyltransferase family 2 protein [Candidatus Woesebacteria bacterium]